MQKKYLRSMALIVIAALAVFFTGTAFAQEAMTVSGVINSELQLITDSGDVYEIGESQKGEELMEHEGKTVEVEGTVNRLEDGTMVITVSDFKLIS